MRRISMTDIDRNPPASNSASSLAGIPQLDPERLRLSQDFAAQVGVKKALLTVPVRKPTRQEFVRVHLDFSWRLDTAAIILKDERETFLVDPSLWPELPGELLPTALFAAATRQGVVFIWPVRFPGPDGRLDSWSRSALHAVQMAQQNWVRVAANMSLGAYDVFVASGQLPDPEWSDMTFQKTSGGRVS
jgi:hypothetical protein